jgi:carboxyl-terminal processing protease
MNNAFKYVIVTLSTLVAGLLLAGAVAGQNKSTNSSDPYRHLHVYTEVFAKIKSDYVEEPDVKSVTLGAINGLLVSVDPFASYLNADQLKQYEKSKSARGGVGLVLSRKYGYEIGIVDAIPGSPADQAGLSTGDMIEAINGVSTRDMPLAFADVMLHGEVGTDVELTVLRLRKPEPTKVKLTRAVVVPPQVSSKMLDSATGYVAVQDLSAGATRGVAGAIRNLQTKGMTKLVLDLRHSVVSEPEEGFELANLFLEKGIAGSLSGQKVPKKIFEMDPTKTLFKGDLVVLTNRGTAGAAEIAATALLENKRAKVVGERTYGDAAVRRPVPTEDGGAVILAVAKYFSPSGKAIQDNPVTPTIQVTEGAEATEDDEEAPEAATPATPAPKSQEDVILKKAIEVLSGGATEQAGDQTTGSTRRERPPGDILTPLGTPKPNQP